MLEMKTNCARSKTIMRAKGQLGARREEKWLESIYRFKILGMGVQVRYTREKAFGKLGRP